MTKNEAEYLRLLEADRKQLHAEVVELRATLAAEQGRPEGAPSEGWNLHDRIWYKWIEGPRVGLTKGPPRARLFVSWSPFIGSQPDPLPWGWCVDAGAVRDPWVGMIAHGRAATAREAMVQCDAAYNAAIEASQ